MFERYKLSILTLSYVRIQGVRKLYNIGGLRGVKIFQEIFMAFLNELRTFIPKQWPKYWGAIAPVAPPVRTPCISCF